MSEPQGKNEEAVEVRDVHETRCCIVGGGPGGLMLALFLARQGIDVTLLEAHNDFDRDFRGDTVHPSTLEVLDQIGLADEVLKLPHGKLSVFGFFTREGPVRLGDFSGLKTRFPYVALIPQAQFLEFICARAQQYPSFKVVLGANVQRLVEEDGSVKGVRYRDHNNQWHEVRALLTVAADGRFSRIRHLMGWEPISTAAPMDVLWFRLPHQAADPVERNGGYIGSGEIVVLLDRSDEWQLGYVIPKDGFKKVRAAGIAQLQQAIVRLVPWLADRVEHLQDWHQVAVLSVESNRLPRWYAPGLLLIGDAAHTMSPVGGVGINYAIGDAVEAANVLIPRLRAGQVSVEDLAKVQNRREWVVKLIQRFQGQMQKLIISAALDPTKPFHLPWYVRLIPRLPLLRRLPARLVGFGPRRVRLEHVDVSR